MDENSEVEIQHKIVEIRKTCGKSIDYRRLIKSLSDDSFTYQVCRQLMISNVGLLQYIPHEAITPALVLELVKEFPAVLANAKVYKLPDYPRLCLSVVSDNLFALQHVRLSHESFTESPERIMIWNEMIAKMDAQSTQQRLDYAENQIRTMLIFVLVMELREKRGMLLSTELIDQIDLLLEHCHRLKIPTQDLEFYYTPLKALYLEQSKEEKPHKSVFETL